MMLFRFSKYKSPLGQDQELSGSKGKFLRAVLTVVLNGNILTITASWLNFTPEKGSTDFNLKTRKIIIVTKKEKKKKKKNSPLNQKPLVAGWPGPVSGIFPRKYTLRLIHILTPEWLRAWLSENLS